MKRLNTYKCGKPHAYNVIVLTLIVATKPLPLKNACFGGFNEAELMNEITRTRTSMNIYTVLELTYTSSDVGGRQ